MKAEPSGRQSQFKAMPYWYVACQSNQLGKKPLSVRIWDCPLVLFRDQSGSARALIDRCAHRNVPLSQGVCKEGHIQCPYHGWEFDGEGQCQLVPALCQQSQSQSRSVRRFEVVEQQGFIWVYTDDGSTPNHQPFVFPHKEDAAYRSVVFQADFEGTVLATAENILDVPHTAFLHRGLFRGGSSNRIETVIRRFVDRAECEYIGEPRPSGLMGKILAPKGGEVEHVDRFILPSIAQVSYALGPRSLMTTSALTPISDTKTRMYSVVTIKMKIPTWILRPVLTPIALKVVQQDVDMLKSQMECIEEFGGEDFTYTEVDVLGPSISRLLKKASTDSIAVSVEASEEPLAVIRSEMLA